MPFQSRSLSLLEFSSQASSQLTSLCIAIVVGLFIFHSITWYNAAQYVAKDDDDSIVTLKKIKICGLFLVSCHSSTNFLLYMLLNKTFRDTFSQMFSRCHGRRDS